MTNKYFVIYGERNSGTNYLETILTGRSYHISYDTCAFNTVVINSSIGEIYNNKYGHKHFFGFHDKIIKNASSNIIFIGIIRNPYDWIISLHRDKHHIPPENYDIENFLNKEWYSIQHNEKHKDYGQELMDDRDFTTGNLPHLNYLYPEPNLPKRYRNIFEMRSKKLQYLLEKMPLLTANYELIKYEDLCGDPMSIISQWSEKYDLKLNKSFIPPEKKEQYDIPIDIKKNIDDGIDWQIENKVGYYIRRD
jgi:hypothetical protein